MTDPDCLRKRRLADTVLAIVRPNLNEEDRAGLVRAFFTCDEAQDHADAIESLAGTIAPDTPRSYYDVCVAEFVEWAFRAKTGEQIEAMIADTQTGPMHAYNAFLEFERLRGEEIRRGLPGRDSCLQ